MRFTTLALVAVGLAAPFAVANAQQAPQGYEQGPPSGYEQGPPPGYGQQNYDQQGSHASRHLLSRELRAMLKEEIKSQGDGGRSQVKQAMREHMQSLAAMSPEQQTQMRNQLQAQWNALPADQKQQIEQRLAERREQHQQQHQRGGQYGQQQGSQQYAPQQGMQYGPQGPAPRSNDDSDDE
jgi:hypothetical protein